MISIVVTTYNKLSYVKCSLRYLELQTCINDFEVILIIDGSNDGTVEYIENCEFNYRFSYKVINQGGLANARNIGIEMSVGSHILFMDDDLLLIPNFIENLKNSIKKNPDLIHVGLLEKVHIDAVDGIFTAIEERGEITKCELDKNIYVDPLYEPIKIVHKNSPVMNLPSWWGMISGGNLCFPRTVLDIAGVFDSAFTSWGPEDVDICYRAFLKGAQVKFNHDCVLYHLDHNRDQIGIANSMVRNALMLYKKFKKPKELLAYLNYFNGNISIREFNAVCCSVFGVEEANFEDYRLNLEGYINKAQLINGKKS